MALVLVDDMLPYLLQLKRFFMESLTLHLFQNDVEPEGTTVLVDLTEADFQGYAPVVIGSFYSPHLVGEGLAKMTSFERVFTATGGAVENDIYGYYLTNSDGYLVGAERAGDEPVTIDEAGQIYPVTFDFFEARYTPPLP